MKRIRPCWLFLVTAGKSLDLDRLQSKGSRQASHENLKNSIFSQIWDGAPPFLKADALVTWGIFIGGGNEDATVVKRLVALVYKIPSFYGWEAKHDFLHYFKEIFSHAWFHAKYMWYLESKLQSRCLSTICINYWSACNTTTDESWKSCIFLHNMT